MVLGNKREGFWGKNKQWILGILAGIGGFILLALTLSMLVTKRVQVEAGFEAVLVDKPFWTVFGKGGVRSEPLQTGSKWLFYTTETIPYDVRPQQFPEPFDDVRDGTITADNIPIDFNAYIKMKPVSGKTPSLHSTVGPNWYATNVKEIFRREVRDEVAKKKMSELILLPVPIYVVQ